MYVFSMPAMLDIHTKVELKGVRRTLFENLLVGVNLCSLEDIDRVAKAILKIPNTKLKKITRQEFIVEFLKEEDFADTSGYII